MKNPIVFTLATVFATSIATLAAFQSGGLFAAVLTGCAGLLIGFIIHTQIRK